MIVLTSAPVYVFAADKTLLMANGRFVRDFNTGLIWSRCSVGQKWNGSYCDGNVMMMTYKVALKVAQSAYEDGKDTGRRWRIPTQRELMSIVCKDCGSGIFIDKSLFPNTSKVAYWTQSHNIFRWRFRWSINFANGNKYGNNPDEAELALRLVSDN